ncbi:hypothetical protein N7931_15930 [Catenovulum sp. 2E275]|uniref:hypothetical protein n=1 Tax=Catenovulum sp. 2E275 TaxID=2980497 RepID=UPI0021D2834C|nr:hypothetical protein [Catenovulum sp. 2E275]MCU4677124.1 hypothetical protein [Catenovulum sp. 2E275]
MKKAHRLWKAYYRQYCLVLSVALFFVCKPLFAQPQILLNDISKVIADEKIQAKQHPDKKEIALYFPAYQFSKSMFEFTEIMLQPEYPLITLTPETADNVIVIVVGFDRAYQFVAEKHINPAIIIGVSSQEQSRLDEMRCAQFKNCTKWLYLNSHASPSRILALKNTFFKNKKFSSAAINWPLVSVWQNIMPDMYWQISNKDVKAFKVVEKAVNKADVFVLPADENLVNNTSIRTILQYLYRKRIPAIGYSNATHVAGSVVSSFANYTQALLSARHFLSMPLQDWPRSDYVCYQSYHYNQRLARSIGIHIEQAKLDLLAESLNNQCYKSYPAN